ncbi:MAG: Ig-like domain-containing protein [Clostridia bacterium]|nr:Ig-like domain-containing protein [Clostridia bacterium]
MKKRFLSGIMAAVLTLTAAQGLGFAAPEDAETAPAEGGGEYAADFDAHFAEAEAEREAEMAAHEAEESERAAELEKHIIHKPEHAKYLEAGEELLGIAAEKYSEIVYISNVDELRAIDGHDGGYYELTADIDISGTEWEPLYLTNATFNGKGHTISGMTITKGTDTKHFTDELGNERDYSISYIGFLCSECGADNTNYVIALNITDAVIDVELTNGKDVSIMGQAYSDNCKISGVINESGECTSYGINGGENCIYEGDEVGIGLEGCTDCEMHVDLVFYGMVDCERCVLYGDTTDNGMFECERCKLYGDVGGNGMFVCTDCELYGDMTFSDERRNIHAMYECIDCGFYGNVSGSALGIYGMFNCTDCELYGDVVSNECNYSIGIADCAGCVFYGDVTGDSNKTVNQTYGIIDRCTDCKLYGNITGSQVGGILEYCNNCIVCGDVSSNGRYTARGIAENCIACVLYGNVSGKYALGIEDCANCYISGSVIREGQPKLIVTAAQPYHAYYKCPYCGGEMITRDPYPSLLHCYRYSEGSSYPNYYSLKRELFYSRDTYMPGDINPPEQPEQPEPPEISYTVQVIEAESNAPISGATVSISGRKYTTDDNGVIRVTDGRMGLQAVKIEKAGSVIYTNTSFMPTTSSMNIIAIPLLVLTNEDFDFGSGCFETIKGPSITILDEEVQLFEFPVEIDFSVFDIVKVAYNRNQNEYDVIIGNSNDLQDIRDGEYSSDFAKKFLAVADLYESIASKEFGMEYFANHNNENSGRRTGVDISGFLKLKPTEDGLHLIDGGVITGISTSVNGSIPIPAAPYIYLAYGVKGALSSALYLELTNTRLIDPDFSVNGKVKLALEPSLGAGVGVHSVLAAEAGISGEIGGELKTPVTMIENDLNVWLNAKVYALFNILGYDFKYSRDFFEYQLYPNNMNMNIASISDATDFTPVSRDYLYDMSVMAENPDTIKANLYPYSDVQTVQLSDGRTLMVWLDDDTERADMDRTALYYSILDSGAWSEPQQIDNDGTADFQFALSSSGSGAAVVWQDMNGNMAEDASMSDMAVNTELSYAVFDGSTWGAPIAITDGNSAFEYAPRLFYDGSRGYIAWTENDENSAMPSETAAERVYSVTVSGTSVSEPQCKIENIPLIYETEIGANGAVACIADKDGDKETKDGILYVNDLKCHESDMLMAGLRYSDGGFCFTEGGTLRKSSGSSTYASAVYDSAADGARLITNGSEKAVVYEVQDGFTSNLYASYYKNNAWTNPVRVTDHSEKMRSWDAELASDGTLNVFAVLADISVEDSDVKQSVRLAHTIAEPIESVEVRYIEAEPQRGKTVDFAIGVDNETASDTLNISITGETAGELYSGTAKAENGVINVSVPIPDDFTKQNVTVTVSGESAEGSKTEFIGYADLDVTLVPGGKYAKVTNKGCDTAENVRLTVEGEDGTELAKTTAEALEPGKSASVNVTLPEGYSGYVTASAETDTDEAAEYNNSASVLVSANSIGRLKINANTAVIEPGNSYMPVLNTDTFYGISDNEAVATVDDTGKISAVSEGTATITYTAPGASNAAKVRVYVHKLSAPEITSAEYSSDYVNLAVNTSSCLAEGETEQLIAAAYTGDGTLVGITMQDATAAEEVNVSLYTGEKEPKRVKVMLWNTAQQPASCAAEKLIE